MTSCPTCGRRPSERHDFQDCHGNIFCLDPIHDLADRCVELDEDYKYLEVTVIAQSAGLVTAPEECPPDAVRELARLARDHKSEKDNWVLALRNVETEHDALRERVKELEAVVKRLLTGYTSWVREVVYEGHCMHPGCTVEARFFCDEHKPPYFDAMSAMVKRD